MNKITRKLNTKSTIRPKPGGLGVAVHPLEVNGNGDGAGAAQLVARQKQRAPELAQGPAKASTVPEAMDDQAKGSMRRRKMRPLDQPKVRAASSMLGSKLSKAPRARDT